MADAPSPKPALYFIPRSGTFHADDDDNGTEMTQRTSLAASQQKGYSATRASQEETKSEPAAPRPWWSWMTGNRGYENIPSGEGDHHSNLPRKVPVRVEPKVFFANERTYLAWLHMAIMLATISVAIVALAEKEGPSGTSAKVYGVVMMPVAIAFCVYALHMYLRRLAMLKRRDPGPFDDRVGPTVLGVMLALAIISSFSIKLYAYA